MSTPSQKRSRSFYLRKEKSPTQRGDQNLECAKKIGDCTTAIEVMPVFNVSVRGLCRKPYPGHPKGCPNWSRRSSCPPQAPLLDSVLDLSKPVYCIYNEFDLGSHVERMYKRHPIWSERQLRCCLYWQGKARKQLRHRTRSFLANHTGLVVLYCPEACGVDVTATMNEIGIQLEWPPLQKVFQVAIVGTPRYEFKRLIKSGFHL